MPQYNIQNCTANFKRISGSADEALRGVLDSLGYENIDTPGATDASGYIIDGNVATSMVGGLTWTVEEIPAPVEI